MKKTRKPLIDRHGEAREPTPEEWKLFRPMREVDPELVAAYKRGEFRYRGQRGKQKAPTKTQVTLRIDSDALAYFKAKGEGWQTRISDALAAFADVARQ